MKIIYLLLVSLLLFSCQARDENKTIIKETTEIIDGYGDTLEGTIGDAKEVKKIMEINNSKLGEEINNIY